jgi:hypothetical protein
MYMSGASVTSVYLRSVCIKGLSTAFYVCEGPNSLGTAFGMTCYYRSLELLVPSAALGKLLTINRKRFLMYKMGRLQLLHMSWLCCHQNSPRTFIRLLFSYTPPIVINVCNFSFCLHYWGSGLAGLTGMHGALVDPLGKSVRFVWTLI